MKTMIKAISILMCCCFVLTTFICIDTPIEAAAYITVIRSPQLSSATLTGSNSIKLKWEKQKSVSGYIIYRKSAGGNYKKIATAKKGTYSYTNKSLKYNKKYYYKIRSYKKSNGKTYYSGYSNVKSCRTIGTPKISSVTAVDIDATLVKWNKQSDVTGYELYYKTSGGKFKKLKTLSRKTTSFKHKKLATNKKYFYKIRAYKKVGSKKYYGKYSNIQGVKVTNYLMKLFKPYQISNYNNWHHYNEYASPLAFSMGGDSYTNGFSLTHGCSVAFNLKSKYKKISFVLGNIDGGTYDGKLHIISDNNCVKTCEVIGNNLPKKYTVNIENASKLEFKYEGVLDSFSPDTGIANIKLYK